LTEGTNIFSQRHAALQMSFAFCISVCLPFCHCNVCI